jgi:hypothetical protein
MGNRQSYAISIKAHWFHSVLRTLVEIGSPAKARAHILLEVRINGQNSIAIAHPGDKGLTALPFDRWGEGPLGAGFSYEDFLETQYFWPEQVVVKEAKIGSRSCNLLKSSPGGGELTHYSEIRTWLDSTIGFPVYAEKTLKGTAGVKEFTYFGIRHNGGVWSASQVEAKVRGQGGSTILIIEGGNAKANLGPDDFSTAKILHF